jgi:hypothetical protein
MSCLWLRKIQQLMFIILEEIERLSTAYIVIQNWLQVVNLLEYILTFAWSIIYPLHSYFFENQIVLVLARVIYRVLYLFNSTLAFQLWLIIW